MMKISIAGIGVVDVSNAIRQVLGNKVLAIDFVLSRTRLLHSMRGKPYS
jgi:hypothetical protein